MKVLHLTHTDIRCDSRVLKEMSSLADGGYHVWGLGVMMEEGAAHSKEASAMSVASLPLVTKRLQWMPRSFRYAAVMIELTMRFSFASRRMRPNIIHCHDTIVLLTGLIVKALSGSKLVYDAHELESDKNGQTRSLSVATFILEKLAWPFVDHFISVSPSIIQWYEETFGPKDSTLILNSPQLSSARELNGGAEANPEDGYFHRLYDIERSRLIFIYVGIFGRGRGLEILLEAFTRDGIESHVVFLGYGELLEWLQKNAREAPNIHVHPPVPHEEVVSIVRHADVGLCLVESVSLSDFFCLPNKMFEYAFSGIPVLASDFPDIRDIVQRYELGWCTPVAVDAIAEAVKGIERDRPARISTDIWDLSWERQAICLREVYAELMEGDDDAMNALEQESM